MRPAVSLAAISLLAACGVPSSVDVAQGEWMVDGEKVSLRCYVHVGFGADATFWVRAEVDPERMGDESLARVLAERSVREGHFARAKKWVPPWWGKDLEDAVHVSLGHSTPDGGSSGSLHSFPLDLLGASPPKGLEARRAGATVEAAG